MKDSPAYRTVVAIKEISYHNEYPKNKEKFIWGLPSKYENFHDREISAFCTCWIYDFTKQSSKAAQRLDEIMGSHPYKFVFNREFDYFIMESNQQDTLYGAIKMSDAYTMFDKLHALIRQYSTLKGAFSCHPKEPPFDTAKGVLSEFRQFNGKSTDSQGRINLFLLMMTHCYGDYDYDSSILLPPLFENRILPTCRALNIIDKKTKKKDLLPKIVSSLQWFSKENPMTYWIGIATYNSYIREHPKTAKKFASMKLVRHPFKKK